MRRAPDLASSKGPSWSTAGNRPLAPIQHRVRTSPDPERRPLRSDGLADNVDERRGDGLERHLVPEPEGESLDGPLGVQARAIEAPVDRCPHPSLHRAEQGGGAYVRRSTGT